MKSKTLILCSALLAVGTLQGCATAVVGGAATGAAAVHDRRSVGTNIDDQTIEVKLFSSYSVGNELGGEHHISATSYNYVVLLTGQASSESVRRRAEQIAVNTSLVKRVVNEIKVGPNASLTQRSTDSWITSKAKVELFDVKLPGFDPTRIKVVTEMGVVYLMGLVTPQEADAAVEQIRYLRGVKQVVKVFEYI